MGRDINWSRINKGKCVLKNSPQPGWFAVVYFFQGLWTFRIGVDKRCYTWERPGWIDPNSAKDEAVRWMNWIVETEKKLQNDNDSRAVA